MQSTLYEDGYGIRRFKSIKIQTQIDDAIRRLADTDKKFIVVGHTDDSGVWKVSSAIKLGDKFSVQAAMYDNWKKPEGLSFSADVIFSPF